MSQRLQGQRVAAVLLLLVVPAWAELWGLGPGLVLERIPAGTCAPQSVCALPPPLLPHAFPAGGADWDTCTDTVWLTDGISIVNMDRNCGVICTFPGISSLPAWGGLAVDPIGRQVYAVSTTGLVVRFAMGGTCLTIQARCLLPAGPDPYTGLAFDAFTGSLWACDAMGRLINFQMGLSTCNVLCTFQVQCSNPIGLISGLAFDSCARLLHLYADPNAAAPGQMITAQVTGTCGQTLSCCGVTPPLTSLSGLAFRPPAPTLGGTPGCSGPNCPPCAPQISSQGLPVLGTSCFRITLDNAACPSSAFLFISLGGCMPQNLGLCGPVFINLNLILFTIPVAIPACTPVCAGNASFTLPIPPAQSLCGLPLCAQWAIVCPGGGISLTGPLSFQLVGP